MLSLEIFHFYYSFELTVARSIHTGWSRQEPQIFLAVLFSSCTAQFGILSSDLDSSEQAALGDVVIF